ncbi:MAG TPA: PilZ domain-containing protein [Candidatus Limnocylindrales bacterium]|nr:PilZ domain-containing protein [Candidatus Limnocylindrales bacterium]
MSPASDDKKWTTARQVRRISPLRDLSVTYEGRSEDVALRPPDISTRGMFINTNQSFPEGAVLIVQFRLGHSGVEISTRAEVRYCLPGVGVGVEFVGISEEARGAIERELQAETPSSRPLSGNRTL